MSGRAAASDDEGYVAQPPRALSARDVAAARALVHTVLGATPYVDRVLELLDDAARADDPEARALVIERDGTLLGLVIFGLVAGTRGAAKLHALVLDRSVGVDDVGGRLTEAAAAGAASTGARLLIAELPDESAFGAVQAVLLRCGFHEEARVQHFFRDGVALAFLRRDLTR